MLSTLISVTASIGEMLKMLERALPRQLQLYQDLIKKIDTIHVEVKFNTVHEFAVFTSLPRSLSGISYLAEAGSISCKYIVNKFILSLVSFKSLLLLDVIRIIIETYGYLEINGLNLGNPTIVENPILINDLI